MIKNYQPGDGLNPALLTNFLALRESHRAALENPDGDDLREERAEREEAEDQPPRVKRRTAAPRRARARTSSDERASQSAERRFCTACGRPFAGESPAAAGVVQCPNCGALNGCEDF